MQQLEDVLSRLETAIQHLKAENATLKAKLLIASSDCAELKKELSSLQDKNSDLRLQLDALSLAQQHSEHNNTEQIRGRIGEYIKYIDIIIHHILTENEGEETDHITTDDR